MNLGQTNENSEESQMSLWVFAVAGGYFLLHMLTATSYGYFRDALYYLACSEHLDWGYVDQPPLIVALAWFARHTLGTSRPTLLFWPALAGAGRIVLTAAFARELGAGRFGSALAAMLAATPPVWYVLTGEIVIRVGAPIEGVRSSYESVTVGATIENPYAFSNKTRPILLCRGRKENYQTQWSNAKKWE